MAVNPSSRDQILGQLAVERKLLTDEQLAECVREQTSAESGGKSPRPLGIVMLSKGFLQEKDLLQLLREQDRKIRQELPYKEIHDAAFLFGQLLVKTNKATQLQINKCLEIQEKMAKKGGPIPRLGELLVDHGFVDRRTVTDVLKIQNKDLFLCTGCGKQFNVVSAEDGKAYRCKGCGGVMIHRALIDSLRAEETSLGFDLPMNESEPS